MGHAGTAAGRSSGFVPGIVALIGGLLLVVGSLMSWVQTTGPAASEAVNGIRSREGKIAFVCGLILVAAAVVSWLASSPNPGRAMFIVALVAALIASGFLLYDVLTKDRQIDDAIRTLVEVRTGRVLTDQQVARAREILARQGFSIEFQAGIWLALAGGVIGVVGAVWGTVSSSTAAPVAAPAATGFGFTEPSTGWASSPRPPVATEPPVEPEVPSAPAQPPPTEPVPPPEVPPPAEPPPPPEPAPPAE